VCCVSERLTPSDTICWSLPLFHGVEQANLSKVWQMQT
jgi:hypothetical protein